MKKTYEFLDGIFRGSKKGFGFVEVDKLDHDIFIPKGKTNNAMDGDTVLVKIEEKNIRLDKDGEIDKVTKRNTDRVTGEYIKNNGFGFVVINKPTFNYDIFIGKKNDSNAQTGDIVVCDIISYPKDNKSKPEGKIVEILGNKNSVKAKVLSLIKSYDVDTEFTLKELEEGNKVARKDMVLKNREDYTNLKTITIDGDDAKDFDDAISIEKVKSGYKLYVHIADVSYYIENNSLLDREALKRGNSIYTPNLVIPMLPTSISNGVCSLSEGNLRLTMTVIMNFDKDGKISSYDIKESYIRSNHRLTYSKVDKILKGDKELIRELKDVYDEILAFNELASKIIKIKEKQGMIDFESHESSFTLNKKGEPIEVKKYETGVSNRIIEMFMISANECVAEYLKNLDLPCVYRVHEKPNGEKLDNLKTFVNLIGYNFKIKAENLRTIDIQKMLKSFENTPLYSIVNKVALRSMSKAKYSTINEGHFGLSSDCYCHFTSPIRRYSDLMVHRSLRKALRGEYTTNEDVTIVEDKCIIASENCSVMERKAESIERDVDDLYKCLYIKKHIGESFFGVISGVTEFGAFVELDNTVEGLVKIENLFYEKEKYIFNEKMLELKGEIHSYKLGDKVEIEVFEVDMDRRKIEFLIYE